MASSPSRYLGSAILQGLGAGATGYENVMTNEQQRAAMEPEIASRNVAAMNNMSQGLLQYNAMNNSNLSLQDYAKMMQYKGYVPPASGQAAQTAGKSQVAQTGQGQTTAAPQSTSQPAANIPSDQAGLIQAYNRNDIIRTYMDPSGKQVQIHAQQDPAFLQSFLAGAPNAPAAWRDAVKEALTAMGTSTVSAAGERVPLPGSMALAGENAANAANTAVVGKYNENAANFNTTYQTQRQLLDSAAEQYKKFTSGPIAAPIARYNATASQLNALLGTNLPTNNPEAFRTALKDAAQLLTAQFSSLPGDKSAPMTEINMLRSGNIDPDAVPGAVHNILAQLGGRLELANSYYSNPQGLAEAGYNMPTYQKKFNETHNLGELVQQEYDKIGTLSGEVPVVKNFDNAELSKIGKGNQFIFGFGEDRDGNSLAGKKGILVRTRGDIDKLQPGQPFMYAPGTPYAGQIMVKPVKP
jgi:hypothetical protein